MEVEQLAAAAPPFRSLDVVAPEPGRIVLEQSAVSPPGPGQVLVAAEVSAVSPGTERAWFTRAPDTPGRFPYRPGYCHVGRVVALGPDVKGVSVGDRVLSQAHHGSLVRVRAGALWRVPEGLSPELAAFAPLAAISLQGVRKAGIELGASVAILGAGIIGLFALQFARLQSAAPIYVGEPSAFRRDLARKLGATAALPPDELLEPARTAANTERLDPGFECVIDATGHPQAFNTSISIAASGGVIVLLGSPRGRAHDVNVYEIHRKGLHIIGAHARNCPLDASHRDMWTTRANTALALTLMQQGELRVEPLITDRVAPAEVPALFERLKAGDERLIGCVSDWTRQ